MRILQRYLSQTVIQAILLVLLVFIGLDIFIVLMSQLKYIGHGDYGIFQALAYVLLTMPMEIYQIFPVIGLVGVLIGLGILANNRELVVMRSGGVSLHQLFFSVVKTILCLIVVAALIGEVLAPKARQFAMAYRATSLSGGQAIAMQGGLWLRDEDRFIHIRKASPGGLLEDVSMYQFNNHHQLLSAAFAKRGYFQAGKWHLEDISISKLSHNRIRSEHVGETSLTLAVNPELLGISDDAPEEMTLVSLYDYLEYRYENDMQGGDYELQFWKRLFEPLAILVMMLLAMPFVFGPLRSATLGFRLMVGILVGFSFYIFNEFVGPMSVVYQFPTFIAMLLPIALFTAFGFFMMSRVR